MYQVIGKHLKSFYLLNFINIGISDFCQQMFKKIILDYPDMIQTPLICGSTTYPVRRLKPINIKDQNIDTKTVKKKLKKTQTQ